ncbi:MAG: TIGR03546 family protein [Candidatus Goldbacteria bacterium]|nr:TIGR03546 family protein [Candidatus Goldiibacteriota bacterium]
MFKNIKKILKFLNSQADPVEIAIGVVLGLFAAFLSPSFFNLILLFVVALILNCNFGIFFLCTGLFKILTPAIDPIGNVIGKFVLTMDFLLPLWKAMANVPVLTFTSFNNTVIMGDFIIGIILTPIVWMITLKSVEYYRKNLMNKVKKFKIMQILTGLDFVDEGGR